MSAASHDSLLSINNRKPGFPYLHSCSYVPIPTFSSHLYGATKFPCLPVFNFFIVLQALDSRLEYKQFLWCSFFPPVVSFWPHFFWSKSNCKANICQMPPFLLQIIFLCLLLCFCFASSDFHTIQPFWHLNLNHCFTPVLSNFYTASQHWRQGLYLNYLCDVFHYVLWIRKCYLT